MAAPTTTPAPRAVKPPPGAAARPWHRRPELVGVGMLTLVGLGVFALGAGWIPSALEPVLAGVLLAVVVGVIVVAFTGTTDTRRRLSPYGLLQPGMLWLCLFFLAPVWSLAIMSLSTKQGRFDFNPTFDWNFGNYVDALTDFRPQFMRAFLYSGTATLLCVAIGYPLAYVIAFRAGRWKNILLGLVVVPFFTSYLIRTIAWQTILFDEGPVVRTINALHLGGIADHLGIMHNGGILNTPAAVIGGLTYNFLPFMVLPIYVALEKIDLRLVDAAKDLYSSAAGAFRKVVLPLSMPGVFAGSLLTFIPAAGDFVNAQFLGGPNTTMIGNSIQDQFLRQNNYPLAAAMAFVLMIIITVAVLIYARVLGTEDIA